MHKDTILTVFVSMLLLSSMVSIQFAAPVRAATTGTAMIDLYTQKGGKGPNTPSRSFRPEEEVILYAYATYNSEPVSANLVTFVIHGPPNHLENFTLTRSNMTNATGVATTNFGIPWPDENPEIIVLGIWIAYASVEIVEEKVEDTLTFMVGFFTVGGIYIPVNKLELLAPYIRLTILLAVAVTTVAYVNKRKRDTEIIS